jgi:hypothetical protein
MRMCFIDNKISDRSEYMTEELIAMNMWAHGRSQAYRGKAMPEILNGFQARLHKDDPPIVI